MAQNLNLFLQLGALSQVGQADLNADDSTPKGFGPGAISLMSDAFGFKVFKYGISVAAQSKGELTSLSDDITGTVTAAAGELNDTTHYADTTNWASANLDRGKIAHITDDAGAAGAAPENDVSIVAGHGVTQVTLDSHYPLSAAPGVGDTYSHKSVFHTKASADGELTTKCFGVIMQDRTAGYWGWYQIYGVNPGAKFKATTAVTALNPVVSDAACLGPHGCDKHNLWVGRCLGTRAADTVTTKTAAFIDLWTQAHPITVG